MKPKEAIEVMHIPWGRILVTWTLLAKLPLISVAVDFVLRFRYSVKGVASLYADLRGLEGVK